MTNNWSTVQWSRSPWKGCCFVAGSVKFDCSCGGVRNVVIRGKIRLAGHNLICGEATTLTATVLTAPLSPSLDIIFLRRENCRVIGIVGIVLAGTAGHSWVIGNSGAVSWRADLEGELLYYTSASILHTHWGRATVLYYAILELLHHTWGRATILYCTWASILHTQLHIEGERGDEDREGAATTGVDSTTRSNLSTNTVFNSDKYI